MASQTSLNKMNAESFISHCSERSSTGSSTEAGAVELRKEFPLHRGVRDTREFLSDVGGNRTRWPVLVGAGLLAVCLIGYSASSLLFKKARSVSPATPEGRAAVELGATGPAEAQIVPENASRAIDTQSRQREAAHSQKPKKTFGFSFQAEAEAAQEHDFPVDLGSSRYPENLNDAKNSLLYKQVDDLLKSASDAVRNENLESFLAHLDESEPDFVRQQKLKVKFAFRQFDEIDGTYSDIKIKVLSDSELAVSLHCKVNAAYAKTGRPIVLFDGDQNLILRKDTGAVWKICAIDY